MVAQRGYSNLSPFPKAFYLVKWTGLDYKDATWEDKQLLKQIPSFNVELDRFRARKRDPMPVAVARGFLYRQLSLPFPFIDTPNEVRAVGRRAARVRTRDAALAQVSDRGEDMRMRWAAATHAFLSTGH